MWYPMKDQSKKTSGDYNQEPSNNGKNFVPFVAGKIRKTYIFNIVVVTLMIDKL